MSDDLHVQCDDCGEWFWLDDDEAGPFMGQCRRCYRAEMKEKEAQSNPGTKRVPDQILRGSE